MSTQEPRFERSEGIGAGATSTVELAHLIEPFQDLPAGQAVAVKTLRAGVAADAEARAAFRSEAEAGTLVRDPSLVRVLHQGEDTGTGRPYLLLQYVPGRSLREILDEDGSLPEPLVRRVGAQLAGALGALHGAGLVHGDVKPENIRLDDEGRAVLVDLGFARRFHDAAARRGAGSLAYLSPERARGGGATAAADVFALGVVLYELAAGIHPFGYKSGHQRNAQGEHLGFGSTSVALLRRSIEVPGADELLAALATAKFVPPSHLHPQLSPFVDVMLEELLARTPGDRPTAHEACERLRAAESSAWWRARLDTQQGKSKREEMTALRSGLHLTPLVGREPQLEQLASLLARVRETQKPALIWLTSPEGGGKWRLVSEFAARARASLEPPIYLYARWTEASESRPAGMLLLLLHRWLRLPLGAVLGEREQRLLEELVPPHAATTLLAALAAAPKRFEHSVSVALAAWLTALGRKRPVILFLDDLQRAGDVTIEALAAFLGAVESAQLMLVLGARDEFEERTHVEALHERLCRPTDSLTLMTMRLHPLDEADITQLVSGLFDKTTPRVRLSKVLAKRSQGNPGLLTEMLYDLIEKGHAVHAQGGRLHLVVSPEALPPPRSLDRLISERFAGLAAEDRRWLERLAIVGGRITPDFLVAAFPPTERRKADEVLARLTRLGWIVAAGDRYRFARPALRETIYRSLSPARRRRLHAAAADGFVPAVEEDQQPGTEDIFQRVFHLRAAGDTEELVELVLQLVRSQRRRASARRLFTLAEWGLSALKQAEAGEERGEKRLELLEVAADAADRLGLRDEQRGLLDTMFDTDLDLATHPMEGARLYLLHGRFAAGTGQYGLARGLFRNAVQLAQQAGDRALMSQAYRRMAHVQSQIGEFEDANRQAAMALDLAQGANQEAIAHLAVGHLHVVEDRTEAGLRSISRALEALRGADDIRLGVVAYAHLLRARALRSLGQAQRALGSVRRAVRLAQRAAERRLETEARARYGGLLLDLDLAEEAEAQLRDALLAADEIEDRRGQILAGLWLGLLLWEEDDREAQAMIERGIDLADDIGFYRAESFGLAILARVRRAEQDLQEADTASERALSLQKRHGAEVGDRIAVSGTRALVLRSLGREREAKHVLRELEQSIARGNKLIRDAPLRRSQRAYAKRLLAAVISPDGPVNPRR